MKSAWFRLALLVVLASVVVAGCAPAAATPAQVEVTRVVAGTPVVEKVVVTATAAPVAEKPFKVAIVMPSTITDMAFSQSMYEGLKAVQTEMGGPSKMEIAYSENMFKMPDAAAALRDYASQGYNLVIAHGSQYGTSLAQIAPDFPEISFAWGASLDTFQSQGITNVFAYQAEAQQGGYVLGVLAAMMSKTGTLGVAGPVEAGDAKLFVDGFKFGAEATKPGIKVPVTYTGSFSDVSLMASAAETHIANGADVLTGSSQSVVGAIGVAKDKKAFWFGTQWDQTKLAPETVVASQVYDWTGMLKEIIASRAKGVLGGTAYKLQLNNGGLKIAYNSGYALPADVKAAADKAIADIKSGAVTVQP